MSVEGRNWAGLTPGSEWSQWHWASLNSTRAGGKGLRGSISGWPQERCKHRCMERAQPCRCRLPTAQSALRETERQHKTWEEHSPVLQFNHGTWGKKYRHVSRHKKEVYFQPFQPFFLKNPTFHIPSLRKNLSYGCLKGFYNSVSSENARLRLLLFYIHRLYLWHKLSCYPPWMTV